MYVNSELSVRDGSLSLESDITLMNCSWVISLQIDNKTIRDSLAYRSQLNAL